MNFLFEVDLQYMAGMPAVWSTPGRLGDYLGSGEGVVRGANIQGTVRWDLFEKQSQTLCESNLRGVIETKDGSLIEFDSLGFFMRPDQWDSNKWIASAAVKFDTDSAQYAWLNTVTAVWRGEFAMATYRHHYQVYATAHK